MIAHLQAYTAEQCMDPGMTARDLYTVFLPSCQLSASQHAANSLRK